MSCLVSLQWLQDLSESMLPSFPAVSWDSWHLPRKGLPVWVWVLLPLLFFKPDCVAWSALVNAICNAAGLSSSWICIFSATAPSSLVHKSLIWEDWAPIFWSHLHWDVEAVPSFSDPTPIEDVETDLPDVLVEHWWVPRTLASSFLNCVNDFWHLQQ